MATLNEPISNEMNELDKLKILRRKRIRNERKEQQREDNHWAFIAGTLVAKYLKADLDIPVHKGQGASSKNAVSFTPLENILKYLSAHKEFTTQISRGEDMSPPSVL